MIGAPIAGVLGLDLGGSSVKYVVLEHEGDSSSIVLRGLRELPAARDPETVVAMIAQIIWELSAERVLADHIGVALPGLHDSDTGRTTLLPNFPEDWNGYPLRQRLADRLDQAVVLDNDARTFSLAEATLGAAAGYRAAVCVVLGTGVGGGVVLEGRLWRGQGTGGEIGHQTVELDGPACGCGNRGCVEALAGSAALLAAAGRESVRDVYEAARAGEQRSVAAVNRAIRALGAGLANCYAVLAPDVFVVGGGIADAGDQILKPLQDELRRRVRVTDPGSITVVRASLGRHAGAIGAALLAGRATGY